MTLLPYIADLTLLSATVAMAVYCRSVMRRNARSDDMDARALERLDALEGRLADMHREHADAAPDAIEAEGRLTQAIDGADDRIGRLELLLAGLEDVDPGPERSAPGPSTQPSAAEVVFRAARAGHARIA